MDFDEEDIKDYTDEMKQGKFYILYNLMRTVYTLHKFIFKNILF